MSTSCLTVYCFCKIEDDNEESDENEKENPSEVSLKRSLKKLKKRYLHTCLECKSIHVSDPLNSD